MPLSNGLSDIEDISAWASLSDRLDTAIDDPTILLDGYQFPVDGCHVLVNGIVQGTACIVSDGSFNPDSLLNPTGTSAVVLALSTNCATTFYAKENNWITGSKTDQSAYRSELEGVIAVLTLLDILVCHHDLTSGSVTIALDGESALIQSGGD